MVPKVLMSMVLASLPVVACADTQVASLGNTAKADKILVLKGERRMYLLRGDEVLSSYSIALGRNPIGHKIVQGDGRTPEGRYMVDARNPGSRFYLSLRVSYPNATDAVGAYTIGADPGGDIMIHGQPNGYPSRRSGDWTEGCIAVGNPAMREIWAAVDVGTQVQILP